MHGTAKKVSFRAKPQPTVDSDSWPRPEWQGGWWSAIGHWLARVRHDGRRPSV